MKAFFLPLCVLVSSGFASAGDVGLRLRLGVHDKEATDWSGTVSVAPGKVTLISGWRFAQQDKADGVKGWSCRTHPAALDQRRSNNPNKQQNRANANANASTALPMSDTGVLISLSDVSEDSQVTVKTAKGEIAFKLSEVPLGKIMEQLGGAAEIERTAAAMPFVSDAKTDDDFPAAAVAPDGTAWVAWQSFTPGLDRSERAKSYDKEPAEMASLAKAPGGDQLWLRSVKGASSEPLAITAPGRDIYKSAVAVDGKGTVWVFWSENSGYKAFPENGAPNFDIWARSLKDGKLSEPIQISNSPESDIWPVAATDSQGNVWVAWQGAREKTFRIFERHQTKDGWSAERQVSTQKGNCWAPAITASPLSKPADTQSYSIAIAYDTYDKGDYDVWVAEMTGHTPDVGQKPDSQFLTHVRAVANTSEYEARPALTYDHDGALWISWEKSGPTWGKDWGAYAKDKGIGLYRDRQIGLAILKDGKWMQPAAGFESALPGAVKRRNQKNVRVPAIEPGGESRKAGEEAEAAKNFAHNNLARIITDSSGRVWLFARARQNDFRSPLGSVWLNWATYYDGDKWIGPILIPHSDNLLYNTPVVLAPDQGGLVIVHSSDHRQDRHIVKKAGGGNSSLDSGNDPFDNDLYISRLSAPEQTQPSKLIAAKNPPSEKAEPSPATVSERADIARCREYRANIGGKELQILRGEFHRHTEISGDGGNDGPLEDMWRYAVDVANMDWLGCGDHDNGGGREYPWWLTQKTTDAFFLPGAFDPMYTYERSVRYPEGHRNVVFARRGIRTLPRLPKTEEATPGHAPDTQMLYKYLRLFDGVCASHTSATDMGTDWRDWDAEREPMVEIYQGARQNYERPGAPRSPTADDAIGGWRPKGFVNLALLKGYKFSFESSSDHGSTHISYAMILAEGNTREAIVAAMKKRHTYAATDNIIADYRCGEHMMGDEFTTAEAPAFRIHLEGTAPFAKVVFVKDDVEVFTAKPGTAKCDVKWTDPNPKDGTSYYYVRGEQANGELVWASPMWITFKAGK